ncbi:MAG: alpha/beta hydrolase [Bacteroidota bacterium]
MSSVILLHGALGTATLFHPLLDKWSTENQVLTLDFPGHGSLAGAHAPMTISSLSTYLIQWMDERSLFGVHIFGYSMGGYVALTSALQRPDLFDQIVTLGTKFEWSPAIAHQETRKLNPEKIQEKVPAFAEILANRHGESNWQKVVNQTADLMTDLGRNPILTADTLSQIEIPVHIMLGDQDQMVTQEESQWVAQHLPQGDVYVLAETSHPLEKVDPSMLIATLERFFYKN